MIEIIKLTFNPFQENTYILYDDSKECVIIDPGCYTQQEKEQLLNAINGRGLKPVKLINTHCHIDHVFGNAYVQRQFNLPLGIHQADLPTLKAVETRYQQFGFNAYEFSPEPEYFLNEGEEITFGNSSLQIISCPGHAPGHVVFYNASQGFVINGDVLFRGSFGRVDLPGGNIEELKHSITQKMFQLPGETVVYSGHGPETTIGYEKQTNPIWHY